MENLERYLREHPFFQGLGDEHLELLTGCASNVHLKAGSFVFKSGEAADKFFVIRDGWISVELYSPERGACVLETLGPGEVLGWSWLFPPFRWHFDARVAHSARLTSLDGVCLRTKCEKDAVLGKAFLERFVKVVIRRLEAARIQLLDLYKVGP